MPGFSDFGWATLCTVRHISVDGTATVRVHSAPVVLENGVVRVIMDAGPHPLLNQYPRCSEPCPVDSPALPQTRQALHPDC